MQTFLPYKDFSKCAKSLDRQRLGKQRVEAMQILKACAGEYSKGWLNHPAVLMWKKHEEALVLYGVAICDEWISRGYKDTCREKIIALGKKFKNTTRPDWLGNEKLHESHKSNLVRKKPDFYSKFWPEVRNDLDYVWPTRKEKV